MSDLVKPSNWTEEETQNVVGLFQILLNVDKRVNPHLYQKIETKPKSLENMPDKQRDNSHLRCPKTPKQ